MTLSEFKQLLASLSFRISQEKTGNNAENQSLQNLQTHLSAMSAYVAEMESDGRAYSANENKEMLKHISEIRTDMRNLQGVSDPFKNSFTKEFEAIEQTVASLDPAKNEKLADCMDHAELTVRLQPNEVPDFMGNISSKRFMIKVNGREGFFTIDRKLMVFDEDGTIRKQIENSMKDAVIKEEKKEDDAKNEAEADNDDSFNFSQDSVEPEEGAEADAEKNENKIDNQAENKEEEARVYPEDTDMKKFCRKLLDGNNLSNFLMCMYLRKEVKRSDGLAMSDNDVFDDPENAFDCQQMQDMNLDFPENPYMSIQQLVKNNQNIQNMLLKIRNSVPEEVAKKYVAECTQFHRGSSVGIYGEQGSSVTGRSVATSRVNTLLGVPDISARTTPITVQWNGQTFHGAFMEKAKGFAFPAMDHEAEAPVIFELFTKDGPKMKEPFQGEGLKTVSDQIIADYICQNVDRHVENMLYSFDESGKFTGTQGIDNDLSFGTRVLGDNERIQNGVSLNNIRTISASMKAQVESLTRETLSAALKDTGLTANEINAACDRLDHLKEHLRENLLTEEPGEGQEKCPAGKVRVIEDGKWSDFKLKDFRVGKDDFSVFENLDRMQNRLECGYDLAKNKNYFDNKFQPAETKTFKEAKERNPFAGELLEANQKELQKLRDDFKKTERFHGSKKQYDDMQAALDKLLEYDPKQDLTLDEIIEYNQDLIQLQKAAQAYIDYKEPNYKKGSVGETRLNLAKALQNKLGQDREFYQEAFNHAEERYLQKANDEYVKERREANLDRVIDKMTEKICAMERHQNAEKDVVRYFVKKSPTISIMLKAMNNDDIALALRVEEQPDALFAEFKQTMKNLTDPKEKHDLDRLTFHTKAQIKKDIKEVRKKRAREEKAAKKAEKDAKKAEKKAGKKTVKNPTIK